MFLPGTLKINSKGIKRKAEECNSPHPPSYQLNFPSMKGKKLLDLCQGSERYFKNLARNQRATPTLKA